MPRTNANRFHHATVRRPLVIMCALDSAGLEFLIMR